MISACPICANGGPWIPVMRLGDAPLTVSLPAGRPNSDADFAALAIVQCGACGHVFNAAYDPALADQMYSDTLLTNVPVHASMVKRLTDVVSWIEPDAIAGAHVIEVGAGSGHLARVVAQHAASVTVYEPCIGLTADMLPETNVRLVNGMFSADLVEAPADLVICRQVIEHVADPAALIADIARAIRPGGLAYLEVPNGEYIKDHAVVCEYHQAHVQYFSFANFVAIAARAGLVPVREQQLKGGHDFGVLFRKLETPEPAAKAEPNTDTRWIERFTASLAQARAACAGLSAPIGIYGATWQSQAFLSVIGADIHVAAAFDDNACFHGARLYGGGYDVPVMAPGADALAGLATILVGAYLHIDVIAEKLRTLGFAGDIVSLGPPLDPKSRAAGCAATSLADA